MANLFEAANAPTEVPKEIVVGDFVLFKNTTLGTDYDNSTHTLRFVAKSLNSTNTEISATASASDDDYLFTLGVNTTQTYTPGIYRYQLEMLRNSDSARRVVETGELKIIGDLDEIADPRSHAELMLDKIEAVMENRADGDLSSYSIAGRSITKMSPEELRAHRDYYRSEAKTEQRKRDIKNGRKTSSSPLMRFI
jgi:hypothetical protein|tara:strand:+ start:468 stop:1052 length:585 start_codon:yes stop_codon:yes gene_type:complete